MSISAAAMREPADVALLTGPDAGDVLTSALVPDDGRLVEWAVHTVHHRPGAGVTVGYTATVERTAADGSRKRTEEYLCATTARLTRAAGPGLVRLEPPDGRGPVVHLWRHPADPELPALATACDSAKMSQRLGEQVTLELVAYRPTRRAVLRATGASGRVHYVKVVRPVSLADLVGRHRMLTSAGVPAPAVVAEEPAGLAVLAEGQGESLARVLHRGPGHETDAVLHALVRTLDTLPPAALQLARRSAWSERANHYAHAAATVVPEAEARTRALAAGIDQLLHAGPPQPVVPVHGDFYEANVLMDPREGITAVSSLLDVDSLGPGHRSDDLACLLGHVSVLVHLAPDRYPAVPHVLARWTQLCEQMVDPVQVCTRAAGVTLSLVAGAKRADGRWRADAEGRLVTAEAWLARARDFTAGRVTGPFVVPPPVG
ncbi:phosphotransferase family protein [Georgenia sp. Z1491]|uniref:phosphotransferase family protein n=1 Tax=Georgenia sp. Z1491 TaxID=3416707 RepID=UPI003CF233B5